MFGTSLRSQSDKISVYLVTWEVLVVHPGYPKVLAFKARQWNTLKFVGGQEKKQEHFSLTWY